VAPGAKSSAGTPFHLSALFRGPFMEAAVKLIGFSGSSFDLDLHLVLLVFR